MIRVAQGWAGNLPTGASVRIVIDSISYSAVEAHYYKESISDANEFTPVAYSAAYPVLSTVKTSSNTDRLLFAWPTATTGAAATFEISNVNVQPSSTAMSHVANGTGGCTASGIYAGLSENYYPVATGDGPVNIVVKGLSQVRKTVTFDSSVNQESCGSNQFGFNRVSGDTSTLVTVAVRDVKGGGNNQSLTVNNGGQAVLYVWTLENVAVRIKDVPGCETVVKKDSRGVEFVIENITSDITITKDNFEFTKIEAPKVTGATAAKNADGQWAITLTFDKMVTFDKEVTGANTYQYYKEHSWLSDASNKTGDNQITLVYLFDDTTITLNTGVPYFSIFGVDRINGTNFSTLSDNFIIKCTGTTTGGTPKVSVSYDGGTNWTNY